MELIDTHTHLFEERLAVQIHTIVSRAKAAGVSKMILPNVDTETITQMLHICKQYPGQCFPAIGLHPTSVTEFYQPALDVMCCEVENNANNYVAIGEIGIDLYWDKTFLEQQKIVFCKQIDLAIEFNLPIIIHGRNSYPEIFDCLKKYSGKKLNGVFHCFSGNMEDAKLAVEMGFMLGIGGVITYKNSGLDTIVRAIGLQHLILETDSPWLAPVPKRGQTNEPAYLSYVAHKLSEIFDISVEKVAQITSENARKLFSKLAF